MARRIVSVTTQTPTATADTTNLAIGTFPFLLQGGSATQINYIWEISISGQAAATSSPTFMILAGSSTVGTGTDTKGTGQTDSPVNPATAALGSVQRTGNSPGTVVPQRSSTLHLANCSLNAFGGNYFWRANKVDECFQTIGNVAPATGTLGEITLSAFTGGTPGAIGAHMIYEAL
jgi:hypothetical protein